MMGFCSNKTGPIVSSTSVFAATIHYGCLIQSNYVDIHAHKHIQNKLDNLIMIEYKKSYIGFLLSITNRKQ